MFKKLCAIVLVCFILLASGCASTLEDVNRDAKTVGKTGGTALRVPHSATEGVAEGIAGEAESNPYNR